jgi:hypothetical protein
MAYGIVAELNDNLDWSSPDPDLTSMLQSMTRKTGFSVGDSLRNGGYGGMVIEEIAGQIPLTILELEEIEVDPNQII